MRGSFNKELGILVLAAYIVFKDLSKDVNFLAYIVIILAVCRMFMKYRHLNH